MIQKTCATLGVALVLAALPSYAQRKGNPDAFAILNELNKASTVMTVEQGIVPRPLGVKIAHGLLKVMADGDKPGAKRPGDYLAWEPLLLAEAGPDATRMHSGRSRQDIIPTTRRIMLRVRLLDMMEAMNGARARILATAERHAATVIPGYTNGVQAQPTTLGHYLLGFEGTFDRDAARMREAYARLNLNPLGVAVYGTSSFKVNRVRLAELLGFDANVENGYDAAQLSPMDTSAEADSIAAICALTVGQLVDDIHTQYHQVSPWMLIAEGSQTQASSIMPQKRNPTVLNNTRLAASEVVADAQGYMIIAHNVSPGMPDYKREHSSRALESAARMFTDVQLLFDNLVVNAPRALDEVNAEWSTTTELADVLQREADIPFRAGHHFASDLVTFGRDRKLRPSQLAFADVQRVWTEASKKYAVDPKFPLTEARFRSALSAEGMIAGAQGLGGPQPAEVARMLEAGKKRLADDQKWLGDARARLASAQQRLDNAFNALAAEQAQ
jgi:argininosuccinate lyase